MRLERILNSLVLWSMEADAALSDGTTMVLSPDSEFFRFFNTCRAIAAGTVEHRQIALWDRSRYA